MTSAITNMQLNIRFEAGDDASTANIRIQLGQTDIALPLPAGLRFESTKPLHMSLSIPHPVNQETDYARISTSSTASNEAAPAETAKDKAFKKQLLLPSPASSKVSSKYQTQWPVIGGEDLILDTNAILSSAAFSANFEAGIIRDIYIAGCPGLKHLKGQLSIPIFKVGECAQDRIADRIKQQSKDQYGSYYKINGDWPVQDEGYDEYSALQIYIPETLHENSPVRALTRGLRVTLPKGMSRQQFSNRFQRKLSSCSWIEWRKTEDAIAHFERKNINPDIIDRYTDYGTGEKYDISQATELYCIRNENAQDCKRLIAVIENVILEHMGLI
ncbi:hypothetical protein [Ochrobactrum sp. S1502_03]|uniref:hypothetical protein n=1 Tax=Ochrobactrum sp. S1502_03 TaxID=3108451 RepID=UPI0037C804ED